MKKSKLPKRVQTQEEHPVDQLFRITKEQLIKSPGEETCRNALGWLLEGATIIANNHKQAPRKEKSSHANQAKKFEEAWQKLLPNLKQYADPATLRRHQIEIEEKLQRVLEMAAAI